MMWTLDNYKHAFPIADGHVHAVCYAPEALSACMERRGVSRYALLSLACEKNFHFEENNDLCLHLKQADPKRAYFFAGLHHKGQDYAAYFENLLSRGADGLKLLETKPTSFVENNVNLADPEYDALFALCEERRVPILWHVGDPATFWDAEKAPPVAMENGWFYGNGGFPSLEELYAVAETVLARHPKLHVCFAHLYFCGDDRAHADRLLSTYENLRLDITPGTEMYEHFLADRQGWREFFIKWQDRIQLGTDTDLGASEESDAPFHLALGVLLSGTFEGWGVKGQGLGLPEDVVRKVAYGNFMAFVSGT